MRMRLIAAGAAMILCAGLDARPTAADTLTFQVVADGTATDTNGDGFFDLLSSGNSSLSVRNFNNATIDPEEDQALIEFNLSGLPAGSTLTGATFRFRQVSFTSNSTTVQVFGYRGDGQISFDDLTAPSVLLGSYSPPSLGGAALDLTLNLSAFSGLLGSGPFVGLRLAGLEPTNAQINSRTGGIGTVPTLLVDFTPATAIPEPATFAMLGLGLLAIPVALRRARR